MPGALNLTKPRHLLDKLERELQVLSEDHSNADAAIDALRDGYHLREWIWHDRLKQDQALQFNIMGASGNESEWNRWINAQFPDFPIIRDLCNGSKHFTDRASIKATHQAGWDSSSWDNPESGWDDNGYHVEIDTGQILSVARLVTRVRKFWAKLFVQFPQLD
jgi:hypothetical protein